MNPYRNILKQYLAEHPLDYRNDDIHSLLEFMAHTYLIRHPIESTFFKNAQAELLPILNSLSRKRTHRVFRIINDLCIEHERSAFIEGIRVGAMLVLELNE